MLHPRRLVRRLGSCLAALASLTVSAPAVESGPAAKAPGSGHIQANGFPDDPGFFPIGVWMQSPFRAPAYKAIGINTFVGLWNGPTEEQLATLAQNGMFAVAPQNKIALASPHRELIKAWMHEDEPDNAQKNALGLYVSCVPAQEIVKRTQEMRRKDPTRPIFVNFGRAVADTGWHGRGTCTGDTGYYGAASKGIDIVSFDIYPVAGSDEPVKGRLDYVARGVANLQSWARDAGSVWATVETTRIGQDTDRATPDQIRSEVWLALIQGAKGISYFAHEFVGGFREDGLFRYPDAVDGVKRINTEIRDLAPVLNAPALKDRAKVSGGASAMVTAREHDGSLYVFAGSTGNRPAPITIALAGVRQGQAEVIGENRTVEIRDGALKDDFGAYAVHLYRIRS